MTIALLVVGAVVLSLVSYIFGFIHGHDLGEKVSQGHPVTMDVLTGKKGDQ